MTKEEQKLHEIEAYVNEYPDCDGEQIANRFFGGLGDYDEETEKLLSEGHKAWTNMQDCEGGPAEPCTVEDIKAMIRPGERVVAKTVAELDMAALEIERLAKEHNRANTDSKNWRRGVPVDKTIGKYDATFAGGQTYVREHADGLAVGIAPTAKQEGVPVASRMEPEYQTPPELNIPLGCEEIARLLKPDPNMVNVTVHRVDGTTGYEVRRVGPWCSPIVGAPEPEYVRTWWRRAWDWLVLKLGRSA